MTDPTPIETPEPEENPSIHPSWDKALEAVPDYLRGPVLEQIRVSETEAQKAIEKARAEAAEATPEAWRDFISTVDTAGVKPEDVISGYNSSIGLRDLLSSDPDAFLEHMNKLVDEGVANGTLTRKEGAAAKREAAAVAAEELADDATPEQRELAELRASIESDRAERQAEAARRAEAERQAEEDRQAEAYADEWQKTFNTRMEEEGFITRNEAGEYQPVLSVKTIQQLAVVAASIIDADATGKITEEQAIIESVSRLREAVAEAGGQLPTKGAAPAKPTIPPVGGGGGVPAPEAPPHLGDDQAGRRTREQMMIEEANRLNAAS